MFLLYIILNALFYMYCVGVWEFPIVDIIIKDLSINTKSKNYNNTACIELAVSSTQRLLIQLILSLLIYVWFVTNY